MLDASYALFLQQMRRIYEAAIQHADTLAKKLSPSTSDSKEGKSPQVECRCGLAGGDPPFLPNANGRCSA
jgi:hypothetical protein